TGYSGGELLRYLLNRPGIHLQHLTSESSGGQPVTAVHPHLRGQTSAVFEPLDVKKIAADTDVVFSCYPAGVGIKPNSQFHKSGVKVIDLSGDFRLPSPEAYQT